MQEWSDEGVRQERTGWRCQDISERHRRWGFNCPAVDLDFLMAEYNHGKPCALVEYKHILARRPNLDHPTYQALKDLADNYKFGSLPFIVAIYNPSDWSFEVIPVNDPGVVHYRHVMLSRISEQRFVKSLYLLRKKVLDKFDLQVIGKLNDTVGEVPLDGVAVGDRK